MSAETAMDASDVMVSLEGSFACVDVDVDMDVVDAFCFGDFDFPFDCKNCSRLGSVKQS